MKIIKIIAYVDFAEVYDRSFIYAKSLILDFLKIKNHFFQNQSCQLVFHVHHYCVLCRKVVLCEKLGVLNPPTVSRLNGALKSIFCQKGVRKTLFEPFPFFLTTSTEQKKTKKIAKKKINQPTTTKKHED